METPPKKITRFTDLKAWQESHLFALSVYRTTDGFPSKEQFGLTQQLRRAVLSITSNIAEGFSRGTYADKIRFYEMSLGSLTEVQNQLLFSRDIGYLTAENFAELAQQSSVAGRLIRALIKSSRGRTRDS